MAVEPQRLRPDDAVCQTLLEGVFASDTFLFPVSGLPIFALTLLAPLRSCHGR